MFWVDSVSYVLEFDWSINISLILIILFDLSLMAHILKYRKVSAFNYGKNRLNGGELRPAITFQKRILAIQSKST